MLGRCCRWAPPAARARCSARRCHCCVRRPHTRHCRSAAVSKRRLANCAAASIRALLDARSLAAPRQLARTERTRHGRSTSLPHSPPCRSFAHNCQARHARRTVGPAWREAGSTRGERRPSCQRRIAPACATLCWASVPSLRTCSPARISIRLDRSKMWRSVVIRSGDGSSTNRCGTAIGTALGLDGSEEDSRDSDSLCRRCAATRAMFGYRSSRVG